MFEKNKMQSLRRDVHNTTGLVVPFDDEQNSSDSSLLALFTRATYRTLAQLREFSLLVKEKHHVISMTERSLDREHFQVRISADRNKERVKRLLFDFHGLCVKTDYARYERVVRVWLTSGPNDMNASRL